MFDRLRRHPIIVSLTLLLAATGGGLALFLHSFNLNDYRSQLQASLETALKRPVRIGAIHFALQHGLSLDLSDAAIGTAEESSSLVVDHLLLRLRIAPLLRRQELSFSRILLEGAELRLNQLSAESGALPEKTPAERMDDLIDLLRRTNISSLILRNGRVAVTRGERPYSLDKINLQLDNIAFLSPIAVKASGELSSGNLRTPWQLSGQIEAADAEAPWQATRIDLSATMKGVDLAQLPFESKTVSLSGRPDITLKIHGAPATGLTFDLQSEKDALSLTLPSLYRAPVAIPKISLSGAWQSSSPEKIRDLVIGLPPLTLRGEISLPPTPEAPLVVSLTLPETSLKDLGPLVPDRSLPLLAATLRNREVKGSLSMEKIVGSWSTSEGVQLQSAQLRLREGYFSLPRIGAVANASGAGEWGNNKLTIPAMQATLLGGRSEASGSVTFPRQGEPAINLQIACTALAESLTPLLPGVWQEDLQARGPISFSGKVGGSPSRLLIDLHSRFDSAAIRFNSIPLKGAGDLGELLILGAATPTALELSHARLLLPFAEVRANGTLALDNSGGYTLACDIKDLIIERLPPFLAIQKKLLGRGEVDLRLDLMGDQSGLKSLQGSGDFRNLGLHLFDAVADIRGGSGRMTFSREGIDFPAISGLIGLSPLRASAQLRWLPEFKLTLDLDLAKTRAADLVFKSPKKTFAAIKGRLIITSSAILLEKVNAQILDETTAAIHGRITYDPARVDLEITASRANIAGIIALWQDGEKSAAKEAEGVSHPPLEVAITTKIAQGDLYGVTVQNAVGTILLRDGRLTIEPLRLEIGAGRATVNIGVGPLREEHPLLKISGQAEKIDAAQIQKQLLGRKGSITGTLESTFALQGAIGQFLPTCNGKVDLRIDKGLMRGFTSIIRALALFNVGKILTFDFPDVAMEGLLFDQIKGTLNFDNGVVSTDNLMVASPAFDMAFVGKADLAKDRLDFIIGVKPLQTVDKILSNIPLAGWILTGEKRAFVVANFRVNGSSQDPQVEAIPFSSLSEMAVGIFKRTFGLPAKIVHDVKDLFP